MREPNKLCEVNYLIMLPWLHELILMATPVTLTIHSYILYIIIWDTRYMSFKYHVHCKLTVQEAHIFRVQLVTCMIVRVIRCP